MVNVKVHWDLLGTGAFTQLEALLGAFLQANRENPLAEEALIQAYKEFQRCNERGHEQLTAWVAQSGASPTAVAALAHCEMGRGLKARGTGFASDTTGAQFEELGRWLIVAREHAEQVLARVPDHVPALRVLIIVANHEESDRTYLPRALHLIRQQPSSYYLWINLLNGLQPKWHGDIRLIERYAAQAQEHATANPRLGVLLGYSSYSQAWIAYKAGRLEQALSLDTRALSFGDDDDYLKQRHWTARQLKRFDIAREDITRAITLFPSPRYITLQEALAGIDAEEAAYKRDGN